MKTGADFWISALNLERHPEGGWFREVYRSEGSVPEFALPLNFEGSRNFSTSIYYLQQGDAISSFHRIKSDEQWHYYEGNSPVEIFMLGQTGVSRIRLGRDFEAGEVFQAVVPANTWFAACLANNNGFALMGCTVSPGFDYRDFEMGNRVRLVSDFPGQEDLIVRFTRE